MVINGKNKMFKLTASMPTDIAFDDCVRVVAITDPDYSDRDYKRLGNILLNDYRGCVHLTDPNLTLVAFTYPRWFDDDTTATDGLTFLWVRNEDLEVVEKSKLL